MRCAKCDTEMFDAKLTGNALYPLILTNKKKGIWDPKKDVMFYAMYALTVDISNSMRKSQRV